MHFSSQYTRLEVTPVTQNVAGAVTTFNTRITLSLSLESSAATPGSNQATLDSLIRRSLNTLAGGQRRLNGHPYDITWLLTWFPPDEVFVGRALGVSVVPSFAVQTLAGGNTAGMTIQTQDRTHRPWFWVNRMYLVSENIVSGRADVGLTAVHEIGHNLGFPDDPSDRTVMGSALHNRRGEAILVNRRFSDAQVEELVGNLLDR